MPSASIQSGQGSWGRLPHGPQNLVPMPPAWKKQMPISALGPLLPRGNGRSYGDVALNSRGPLIDMRTLQRFVEFDVTSGSLTCEAGISLGEILDLVVPHGWFLPVTPGTRHATVGGAIANDVHGKNHHVAGTFGHHVTSVRLVKSSGECIDCSPSKNQDLFRATIGGLGLTGFIVAANIKLKKIKSSKIDFESERFNDLEEFFEISKRADVGFEYTVAWVDAIGPGEKLGRGVFFRGNHASSETRAVEAFKEPLISIPFDLPIPLVNSSTARVFNQIYFHRHRFKQQKTVDHSPFFYPLDGIKNWNRMYGPRGFYQYQCVIPLCNALEATKTLLKIASDSEFPSFLAVLKFFGNSPSAGCLSFPMEGLTLALDFPNHGLPLLAVFDRMDQIVRHANGRIYAAKDSRMSRETFLSSQPEISVFLEHVDPGIESDFWRRVKPSQAT